MTYSLLPRDETVNHVFMVYLCFFKVKVLDKVYLNHPGTIKMKTIRRSYVCWPVIDEDIERLVGCCDEE